jgi:hypothetical protein
MDRWSVCKEQEKSRRITASNLEMETKPGFVEEISSDILERIPKRDVGYEMTNNADSCTLAVA